MRLLILLFFVSCTQVTSLNLKKHQFGLTPTKIIWFQVAGLEEEQIAMLRFQLSSDKKTSFEENICFGQTWNYNFYQLRNSAESTFLSQITGKKNIKNSCEDALLRPIWSYIASNGYSTAILENGPKDHQSLLSMNKCQLDEEQSPFLKSLYFFMRSGPLEGSRTFHYSDEVELRPNSVTYDRTCGKNGCGSLLSEDFIAVYNKFNKSFQKHLFIVRDFSYLNALESKNLSLAREILLDIEKTYREALTFTSSNDYLVLLTTGDSKFVDIPDQGKSFYEFEKGKTLINTKRTKLTNLVLSSGARAENLCGIYDDSEVFERILSGPKQQGLELKIINPFR
jgi:hypothetical protein